MNWPLNRRAAELIEGLLPRAAELKIAASELPEGGRLFDFGVKVPGSLQAGLELARVCLSGLGEIAIVPGEVAGVGWPHVTVRTDHPVAACLYSQYAGWQITGEKFFAMGSGPMRALYGKEAIFVEHGSRDVADLAVGVLETRKLPTAPVFAQLAEQTGVAGAKHVTLLVAPTASLAGNLQVVARSVETALHKLHELKFDVRRIESAFGSAPLSPVAKDDLTGIGRTNDAILYGARVTLYVRGDDESIAEVGPRTPACSSASYGEPFRKIFAAAGHDFYKIDPHLFSPAEIVFQNLDTGRVHCFGAINPDVLRTSFGIE